MDWMVVGLVALVVVAVIGFLCSIYRVAKVDKALIITGGKEPVIKVSGGGFVIPIFRKAQFFDLCMITVTENGDEVKTVTSVPITVGWTAQIRPCNENVDILKKAVVSFMERDTEAIKEDVKRTLTGSLRGVVAKLTPEQVQSDLEGFKAAVKESVEDELLEMGLTLVSLNIADVTDHNGYYDDLAAKDREAKRREAAKVRAEADQQIREAEAEADKIAKQRELEAELAVAEKERDNSLRMAEFKIEKDRANADAEIAGQLQATVRAQEIATQEGRVAVVQQEQANLAAQKAQEVAKTEAETAKIKATIEAEQKSDVAVIEAKANAQVQEQKASGTAKAAEVEATGKAKALEAEASGKARALEVEATGKAKAIEAEATASANATKAKGEAEAEIIAKKGAAEAEATRARLLAEAEGEKELAAARASNDKVNFEIEKVKIEAEARIQIATKTAEIMAEIGKNAEFVNIGGAATGGSGNVLLDTLAGVPGLMKVLDSENHALNGRSFNEEVKDLVESTVGPVKGLLATTEK